MKKLISWIPVNSLLAAVFGVLTSFGLQAQDGAKLFKQNCAVCHTSHTDQKLTGPGLKGIFDRAPSREWLVKWIINNQKMIKAGDPYAVKVYEENGKAQMNTFEFLSEGDVNAILDFLAGPPPGGDGGDKKDGAPVGTDVQEEVTNPNTLYIILGVIVVLAILLVTLRSIRTSMQNATSRAEGKGELPEQTIWQEARSWMAGNRRLVGVFVLIIAFAGMKSCWDACWNLGVYYDYKTQKGYKPEQPIKFSHKLHAGDNEIACQYCHSSVEKSRHAGLPTVNVCMNCHKGISSGPQYKETEIAKIYQAAGFDPKSGTYDDSKQNPLRWIKVYNLPDHVYFNHSQHVVVGQIECATCHGDMKTQTVAEQKNQLTMKWCVECHRQTEVKMAGNAYYDRLHKALKEKYAGQTDVRFTVEKIGGLECTKCHY